jgi:hypothetical protein
VHEYPSGSVSDRTREPDLFDDGFTQGPSRDEALRSAGIEPASGEEVRLPEPVPSRPPWKAFLVRIRRRIVRLTQARRG